MSLFRYFQPRDGLPDPRGALSHSLSLAAIAAANDEVVRTINQPKKRGQYKQYSATTRAEIGKYASQNGVAKAARYFSRKFAFAVSETTVRSIRNAYIESLKRKGRGDSDEDEEDITLPLKKRGRPLLLSQQLDTKVQSYLTKLREGGGAVSARIVMAAARGILLKCDRSKLVEFGGHVELSRHWAHSLLKRMNFVQRKATTAKSKQTTANFAELIP